jgi:hypothetical protein
MTAGVAAAVVTHPFDTLTTKVAQFAALKRTDGIWGVLKDTYADVSTELIYYSVISERFAYLREESRASSEELFHAL